MRDSNISTKKRTDFNAASGKQQMAEKIVAGTGTDTKEIYFNRFPMGINLSRDEKPSKTAREVEKAKAEFMQKHNSGRSPDHSVNEGNGAGHYF
jgi:hypothetical protein